jgi:hypothetical protein
MGFPDPEPAEIAAAARAISRVRVFGDLSGNGLCAAMGAMLAADKHQAHAFRAGHRLQPGRTKFALGAVARDTAAAIGAIKGFYTHFFDPIGPTGLLYEIFIDRIRLKYRPLFDKQKGAI